MFEQLILPKDMAITLERLYVKTKEYNPRLSENRFLEYILSQWLESYSKEKSNKLRLVKQKAILRNDLKMAIALSGKTQRQIAKEIGIHYTYLNEIIKGKSEPSITVALLIADALDYPSSKINELFYLEPDA